MIPGQQQGWGRPPLPPPGWYPMAQFPRPGVIPLRPLRVAEIVQGAFATMRVHWRIVLGVTAVFAVLSTAATTVITDVLLHTDSRMQRLLDDSDPTPRQVDRVLATFAEGQWASTVVTLLLGVSLVAVLITITSRSAIGRPVALREVWRESAPRVPRLLGVLAAIWLLGTVLTVVGVAPGYLAGRASDAQTGTGVAMLGLFVTMLVGLWLTVSFSLAPAALMLERQGVLSALARSFRLVRGAWWRTLGVELLIGLIAVAITFATAIPFAVVAAVINAGTSSDWPARIVTGLGSALGLTFVFPLFTSAVSLLYMDQRIRREGLDIELARAAGISGYGPR